jgi:signal transduction histidine kinase
MLPICAQNNPQQVTHLTPTDSLERAFNAAAADTARLSVLLNAQKEDYLEQPDQALGLYQKGLKMAEQMGDNKKIAQLMLSIADIYWKGKANEYDAFAWYQKALEEAEKIQYYEGCAEACINIGLVYDHQGFRDKMYQYELKSIDFTEKTEFPVVYCFMSLMYDYTLDNRIDEANALGERLVQLEKKDYFNAKDKLLFYGYYVRVLKKMRGKAEAVKIYTDKINSILDTIDLGNNVSDITNVAFFCLDINRPDMTIKLATQLLNTKTNYKTKEVKAYGYKYLAEAYEMLGNYPLSIQHYKAYTKAQVDFLTTALKNQSREKVLILESEKALLVKQNEIDKQRLFTILGFLVAALLLLGVILIYRFYKREQKTKQELAQLNATKDKLFAIISHDLMSPIANFKSILMLPTWGLMSQAEFEAIVKALSIKANNLYSTCENVLHWAITQMEGIKANREKISIAAVLNEQISLLDPIANRKQIQVQQLIPNDVILEVDRNHLALIVRNLLQNALKFTHSGGSIQFKGDLIPPLGAGGKGGYQLSIQDNGVGMTPDIVAKLFKIDQNANRTGTAKEGGTGFGLILTKELTELNGGTINVTSEVRQGTTFTLAFGGLG